MGYGHSSRFEPGARNNCGKGTGCGPQPDPLPTPAKGRQVNLDPTVYAVVKWFNPHRAHGFVEVSGGSREAFLHRSVLIQFGVDTVGPYTVRRHRIFGERDKLKAERSKGA